MTVSTVTERAFTLDASFFDGRAETVGSRKRHWRVAFFWFLGCRGLREQYICQAGLFSIRSSALAHQLNTRRALRVGIDVSLWIQQVTRKMSGGPELGDNPALRTLFFRLCRLGTLPLPPTHLIRSNTAQPSGLSSLFSCSMADSGPKSRYHK